MLVGAFSLRGEKMDAKRGILWGLAGFATFSLAPAFGLPPELPTTLAADLSDRQIWWVVTALATAGGLYMASFSRSNLLKILGIIILALPHIFGAPHAPVGGIVPTELNAQFSAASLTVMALFWIVLGAASGWFYGRDIKTKESYA
jgi:cobalt transporter subunit CbtA